MVLTPSSAPRAQKGIWKKSVTRGRFRDVSDPIPQWLTWPPRLPKAPQKFIWLQQCSNQA
eukprot:20848-Heterococcus_DN1.PRE.2